jgi:hypothetical protein
MENEKNLYIENFCKFLVEKNEGKLPTEAKEKLVEDLYHLYENMLGRNMVDALPEELRSDYIAQYDKGGNSAPFDEIARIFGEHIADPEEIMKKTMKQLASLYFKNR